MRSLARAIPWSVAFCLLSAAGAAVPMFMGLGTPGPAGTFNFSVAEAVSADGSTVVGRLGRPGWSEAFRWTSETGMVGLGDLPGGAVMGVSGVLEPGVRCVR